MMNIRTKVSADLYLSFEKVAKDHGLTLHQAFSYMMLWSVTQQSINPEL